MAEKNPTYALQNRNDHAADSFRLMMMGLSGRTEGVFGLNDLKVSQNTGADMNVSVAAGGALMYGDESVTQGTYSGYNDAAVVLAIGAAPGAGLIRWDLVCARSKDAFYSGATNAWDLEVVAGTAAASPVDPALPSNTIALARVVVPNGKVAIVNADITDLRPRVPLGVSPVNSGRRPGIVYGDYSLGGAAVPALFDGMHIWETDTHKSQIYDGAAWVPRGNISIASTAPTAFTGNVYYDTDEDVLYCYNGTAWVPFGQQGRAWTFIQEVNLSGGDGVISITSIPATFTHLRITGLIKTARAVVRDNISVKANNDAGANYDGHIFNMNNVTGNATATAAAATPWCGQALGSSANASSFAALEIFIPGYAQTNTHKSAGLRWYALDQAVGNFDTGQGSWKWRSTVAINRIDLLDGAAGTTFKQFSRMIVEGLR